MFMITDLRSTVYDDNCCLKVERLLAKRLGIVQERILTNEKTVFKLFQRGGVE